MRSPDSQVLCSTRSNMALLNIRLRVVGVFFDKILTLTDVVSPTIKDVLDAAVVAAAGNFVYTAETRFDSSAGKASLTMKSFEHDLVGPLAPTLGGRSRIAGRYVLGETVDSIGGSTIVRAWQYYVIRAGKAVSNAVDGLGRYDVSATNPVGPLVPGDPLPTPGFTTFNRQGVDDGDEIIWRNVSIVRTPTPAF